MLKLDVQTTGSPSQRARERILIAAESRCASDWRAYLGDWEDVDAVADLCQLEGVLRSHRPDVVLLDASLLHADGLQALQAFLACHAEVRFLVVGPCGMDDAALGVLEAGAWGYLAPNQLPTQLTKALATIRKGEIWASRRTLSQVVTEQARRVVPDIAQQKLTAREQEIALLISKGLCRKSIAQVLAISPHTVRNHTRSIFQKLAVTDRMQLALKMLGE